MGCIDCNVLPSAQLLLPIIIIISVNMFEYGKAEMLDIIHFINKTLEMNKIIAYSTTRYSVVRKPSFNIKLHIEHNQPTKPTNKYKTIF